ncbi:MAG: hypothetical protein RJB66_489 [Pseudomonadota bacterium]
MKKIVVGTLGSLTFLGFFFLSFVWLTTERFADIEPVEIKCTKEAPALNPNKPLKVLSWNIQFLAGKNYIFFYDAADGSGKDEAPSREDIKITLNEVTRIIKDESPDVVLLQEVDVDAKRTAHQDQVELLLKTLAPLYPCSADTYYWRAGFAPHPKIMGSIGMKLATFSKYRITSASRHALGEFPANFVVRQFRPKRAILDSSLQTTTGASIRILNTHLEAYSQGSDLMQYQVRKTAELLSSIENASTPWILGGDFNLLMPGRSYSDLSNSQRSYYQIESEFKVLADRFSTIPSKSDINGEQFQMWYTHFPNDPEVKGPDRTIDYILYGKKMMPTYYQVRSRDTQKISDHLPLIATFEIH